jgi:hypothetical protein
MNTIIYLKMTKFLFINCGIHDKNRESIAAILNYLMKAQRIEYKIGSVSDIPNYEVIYSASETINTALYPNKKFIFGPHFSVFPIQSQLKSLQATAYKNSIYIQPSEWTASVWQQLGAEEFLPIKVFPFSVNTNRFQPVSSVTIRENVFVYYKRRHPQELHQLKEYLQIQHITNYRIFDYSHRYNEDDYLNYLQTCQYGIILDAHESQGFAIEEALSCDVPLLVWNAQTMNQEHGSHYGAISCTSISYWSPACGEYFHSAAELPLTFQTFQKKLQEKQYKPRDYILANLSTEKCAERFMELIQF